MSSGQNEDLYSLLPAYYRTQDEAQGFPLRALLAAADVERQRVADAIAKMYANWFIETCDAEAIASIGALTGVAEAIRGLGPPVPRGAVANAIACRRRKGTSVALERMLTDCTGWPCVVDDPEDGTIVVKVWRRSAFEVEDGTPYSLGDGRYTFHPMGFDTPLFAAPEPVYDVERPAGPENVPRLLREFHNILEIPGAQDLRTRRADLSAWGSNSNRALRPTEVLVDPDLGRFVLPPALAMHSGLRVSYAYSFSGDLGGGPYPRWVSSPAEGTWVGVVRQFGPSNPEKNVFGSLIEALAAFDRVPGDGVIRILDSGTYSIGPDDKVGGPPGGCKALPNGSRTLAIEAEDGQAPCLAGNMKILGAEEGMLVTLRGLWIDGTVSTQSNLVLSLEHCTVRPAPSSAGSPGGIRGSVGGGNLLLRISRCITGRVVLHPGAALSALDSIIDGLGDDAVQCPAGTALSPVSLEHVTARGGVPDGSQLSESLVMSGTHALELGRYGEPWYCEPQIAEYSKAADGDGKDAGAFHFLRMSRRQALMRAVLREYVPYGIAVRFGETEGRSGTT